MKTKNIILLFTLCLMSLGLTAQNQDYNYLSDGDWRLSGFGAYMIEFSGINGEFGVSSGGGGALLVNQTFYLGGYGIGLSNDVVYNNPDVQYNISFGHGGLWVGYIFRSDQLLHLAASSKFGWGNLTLTDFNDATLDKDNIFVITPQIEGEVNVNRWFRVNVGLGYRYTAGITNNYVDDSAINGPVGTLSFQFGWFTRHSQRDESRDWR